MGSAFFQIAVTAVGNLLLSLLFIAQGLRILTAKRPFIVSQRWQGSVSIIGFMTGIAWFISISAQLVDLQNVIKASDPTYPGEKWPIALMLLCAIGLFILLLIMVWKSLRGYLVFGLSRAALYDTLRDSLSRMNLTYEESSGTFRLLTLNDKLLVKERSASGMLLINFKRFSNRHKIRLLAAEIDASFKTMPAPARRGGGYALTTGIALLLIISCAIYFYWHFGLLN
jgi:hypothetical protein